MKKPKRIFVTVDFKEELTIIDCRSYTDDVRPAIGNIKHRMNLNTYQMR